MPLNHDNFLAFMSFQTKVNGETYARNEYRSPITGKSTFSADELEEMFDAFERGETPADFAAEIYARDTRTAELMMQGTFR